MPTQKTSYTCPYCKESSLETTAKAPYVRGFLLAYQIGYRNLVGCTTCVRNRILREAGISSLLGWFSLTALIINPFLIVYNLIQSAFVKERPKKVSKLLREMGLPENPKLASMLDAGYILAATMIAADGEIDAAEIAVAESKGVSVFQDFDSTEFRRVLGEHKDLPPATDMAAIFRDIMEDKEKAGLYEYLVAIAHADGSVSAEEQHMLGEVAENMGYQAQH